MRPQVIGRFGDFLRPQNAHIQRVLLQRYAGVNGKHRLFHASARLLALKTQKLTDIGEGISEVQVIQWFVSEGAHVEEWSPLLEVQSDKAADTITSRFAGVIKKLHAKQDDTVKTGSALCEIEVTGDPDPVDPKGAVEQGEANLEETKDEISSVTNPLPELETPKVEAAQRQLGKHATLATPAVRGMLKEYKLEITDIQGTGKDGRVLKEDVQRHIASTAAGSPSPQTRPASVSTSTEQVETPQKLTPLQATMFRTMTASLQIPHFLFSDDVDVTTLTALRQSLNSRSLKADPAASKLTFLPFIIKALSLTLHEYPVLNSRVDLSTPSSPQLINRSNHNIGIAVDTPQGLLVPVIKGVNHLTVSAVAAEIRRLTALGRAGKLSSADLSGGTITVSSVGNLGGKVLAPVIVDGQVAIIGIGKARSVPIFDEEDKLVKAEVLTMSWSGDHRVIDGATVGRAAIMVKDLLEEPANMILEMR